MDREIPYIHIRQNYDHSISVRGQLTCRLGHRIERPGRQEPDGIFAEWQWENGRLTLTHDRYGMYPLYYYLGPGEIGLSPSIPRLLQLGAPADLDHGALAVFLRQGFFLGEDTPFRSIRAIPPCLAFEWRAGRLMVTPRPLPFSPPTSLSRESAVEAYIELFRAAMRRRLPDMAEPPERSCILPLSGGRDSRHILLELCAAGIPPRLCVTQPGHPGTSADDVTIARRVTGALNLPHQVLDRHVFDVADEQRHIHLTGFCARNHGWFLHLSDYLTGRTEVTYDGIGGDVLSTRISFDHEKNRLFELGQYRRVAELLIKGSVERGLKGLLTPQAYARFDRGQAVERLAAECRRFSGAPSPLPLFYFYNRTRRNVALSPYGLLSGIRTVYSPYLDHDLYDFLTSLPARILLESPEFHEAALQRAFPETAGIPFAGSLPRRRLRLSPAILRENSRVVARLRRFIFSDAPRDTVRGSFILPLLVRSALEQDYLASRYGNLLVYLLELERMVHTCEKEEAGRLTVFPRVVRTGG